MDYLRDGIGLRAMAQRDPLVEYQREGFDLFTAMMDGIKEETVGYLFHVEVQVNEDPSGATVQGVQVVQDDADGVTDPEPEEDLPALVTAHRQQITAPGLAPQRPTQLAYSAPGETGTVVRGELPAQDDGVSDDPNASRAQRRRAQRAQRKRN
jgi:preprotein translocase subunit SecA